MPEQLVASRYLLGRSLGAGGMGQVREGEDTVLQRPVAVKTVDLPSHLGADDRQSLRTRVLREARSAARIHHPSSVQVFDVVEDGDRLHVVMELVRAPTLEAVVAEKGPLPPQRAAAVGLGLLGALEAAHRAGIVHRDVKPANVMMLEDGTVKLADFGIASAKDDTRITAAGLVLGTPSYMAPEQATGRSVGAPADLWGLGALLYYAVEGVAPFERGEALPTLNAVLHDQPRPMERADGLAPAVQSLLAKDPELRPTIAQSRAALEAVANGGREATAAVTPSGRTAVLRVPPPAGPATTDRGRDEPPPRSRPAPPPRPVGDGPAGGWGWLAGLGAVLVVALVAALALANTDDDNGDPATPDPGATAPASEETPAGEEPAGEPGPGAATDSGAGDDEAATTAPQAERPDGVPADWTLHRDGGTGYTIWHPPSWAPTPGPGRSTDFRDPATGDYLRVDYVQPPGDDPQEAWEDSSERFAERYGDYEEIRIESTTFKGFDAAIWEYTYQGQHATNLGFVTGDYGFALNFQTAEERWDDRQDIAEAFEAGFSPPS